MALRNQPYLPLYVMDFLSDEKLRECEAESVGVYIMLMCVMHKSETYGAITLKQKYRNDTEEPVSLCFARMLHKQLPYETDVIQRSLEDLLESGVLSYNDETETLYQKRMVRDDECSDQRSKAAKARWEQPEKTKKPKKSKKEAHSEEPSVVEQEDEGCICADEQEGAYAENENVHMQKTKEKSENVHMQNRGCKTDANSENEIEIESEYEIESETVSEIESATKEPPSVKKRTTKTEEEREAEQRLEEWFDEFWSRYPRKVSKSEAKKAFLRINPDQELFEKILAGVESAKKTDQWREDRGQYIPHASTWLHQERWNDEYPTGVGPPYIAESFDPDDPFANW